MTAGYRVLGPEIVSQLHDPLRDFADDVLLGLSERPKHVPSKYFYDEAGSRYFQRIMSLREYYPTRCETEILEAHGQDIVAPMIGNGPMNVVDLGAGDGKKTLIILDRLRRAGADFTFVPIDISEDAMKTLVASVRRQMPDVKVAGLVCEYTQGVAYLAREQGDRKNLVLFLGSNIGNFNAARARSFLRRLWNALRSDDRVLVGFDLKKDIEVLLAAYNDREGITSAFNLNLLHRMNRELGATFDVSSFRHFGTYNVFSGAMESYLVSLEPQVVHVDAIEMSFPFDAWEPLHTEYSYKYLRSDIASLAKDTGFACDARYEDERGWFLDALFRVVKAPPTPKPRS